MSPSLRLEAGLLSSKDVVGVRNDKNMYQLEVAGQQLQAGPSMWQEPAPECEVRVAMTPEDGVRQAVGLERMHMFLANDPVLSQLYGLQQRHALADDLFDALGVHDTSRYMMQPGSPEHMQMAEQQQAAMAQEQQMMML